MRLAAEAEKAAAPVNQPSTKRLSLNWSQLARLRALQALAIRAEMDADLRRWASEEAT